MNDLQKATSVPCRFCGYNATKLKVCGMAGSRPWARFSCDFCGKETSIGESALKPGQLNGVVYQTIRCRCPRCDAPNPPVMSTLGKIRSHKCDCGQTFKSRASE